MTNVVEAVAIGKRYRRGRERLNLRALIPGRLGESESGDQHWALSDLSFELKAGRSLGLIGGNGAGKSTTLKLVAGVVAPTRGSLAVRGRSTSLIELGAGFHPDMTGRENIQFSAAVLGMGPKDLRSRLDTIVEFADIGNFLDTPVKRYSSGMLARLGFSVAAHVDAELIILDEVLAVGDAAFQRKCHVRIEEIRRSGGALLYVTHALWTVPLLCDEAILLKAGAVVARGKPDDVVKTYEAGEGSEQVVQSDGLAVISSMRSSVTVLDPGDPLDVDLSVNWSVPAPHGRVMVMIANGPGQAYAVVTAGLDQLPLSKPGEAAIRLSIQSVPLQPGGYEVYAAIQIDGRVPVVDDMRRLPLEVRGEAAEPSFGPILLPHSWAVPATQA